jgi:diaminohydroxyphosphoribosylaminopyrimidine deaminase / 5-amino-6-(5-phosphoribosylamino)uracil reductase
VDIDSRTSAPHRENARENDMEDARWMQRALAQAQQSKPVSSPNPAVGCVLVREGELVGEGFHDYDRKDHAEVAALQQAGERARGATAYVTLEPCCHTGRTGPCTEALIAAGVARVVAATGDPNPRVHGQGFARLRAAGIEVQTDVLRDAARELNDGFARHIRTGLPFVTLKVGVSLDGRIAPPAGVAPPGRPFFLTGKEALADVQQMRHCHDAILTGINTVLADDPLLTDRTGLARRRPLLRVVLDASLRLPLDAQLVRTAREDVLVFCTRGDESRRRALEARGVRVEELGGDAGGKLPFDAVLRRLGELQILSVMVEGGARINASALAAGAVDKLVLFFAPQLLGSEGVPLVEGAGGQPLAFVRTAWREAGRDLRFSGYLRDPWA